MVQPILVDFFNYLIGWLSLAEKWGAGNNPCIPGIEYGPVFFSPRPLLFVRPLVAWNYIRSCFFFSPRPLLFLRPAQPPVARRRRRLFFLLQAAWNVRRTRNEYLLLRGGEVGIVRKAACGFLPNIA